MASFKVKTRDSSSPKNKPSVYFTCHPDDVKWLETICQDIFKTHDCAIYYTDDMTSPLDESSMEADFSRMNLFVVPVSHSLLRSKNRAMDTDIAYAKEKNIPILPLMTEVGIDAYYSRVDKFGERQYLLPCYEGAEAKSYRAKLNKYLDTILVSKEMAERIRAEFDAYIFLSYRKKDKKYAHQLIKTIHDIPACRDTAVWYDEFLTPGESFTGNIESAMEQSKLFALLVTPSIVEEGNYVIREEYPSAKRMGMRILPTEMVDTDRESLKAAFDDLPPTVKTEDNEFADTLIEAVGRLANRENDDNTEHSYLIGLAYLDGIDVEIDYQRALDMILASAEKRLPSAMEKMYEMYRSGKGVKHDYFEAAKWAERMHDLCLARDGEESEESVKWMVKTGEALMETEISHDKAYEIFRKAYDASIKIYGTHHEEPMNSLHKCCACWARIHYDDTAKMKQGVKMAEMLYKRRVELLGEYHEDTLSAANLVGLCKSYYNGGLISNLLPFMRSDDAEALDWFEIAYRGYEKIYGEDHPDTLTALYNFGATVSYNNKYKGIEIMMDAYERARTVCGEQSSKTLDLEYGLIYHLLMAKRKKEALEIAQRNVDNMVDIYGEENIKCLAPLKDLHHCLRINRRYKQSIEALDRYTNLYVLHSPDGEHARNHLFIQAYYARIYFLTGRWIKAIKAIKRIFDNERYLAEKEKAKEKD